MRNFKGTGHLQYRITVYHADSTGSEYHNGCFRRFWPWAGGPRAIDTGQLQYEGYHCITRKAPAVNITAGCFRRFGPWASGPRFIGTGHFQFEGRPCTVRGAPAVNITAGLCPRFGPWAVGPRAFGTGHLK
jgi:hypothetical protein